MRPDFSSVFRRSRGSASLAAFVSVSLLAFAASTLAPAVAGVGGGFTKAGLLGDYYSNQLWAAPVAFTRKDVRLDFRTNSLPPGGVGKVGDAAFRSVPASNFSVRWTGSLVARFTENYVFVASARDTFRLRLRPAGAPDWTTIIDQLYFAGSASAGAYSLIATTNYDVEILYSHGAGPWEARLSWSSQSTPEEVIDPLTQSGMNNPDWTVGFTDIVKGARNTWEPYGGARPTMDADGWPTGDGAYVFQESLNQGLDVDPLMRGRIAFSFHGSATVSLQGNVRPGSLVSHYDAAQNLTAGSFIATNTGWNASYFRFANSHRDGKPSGPGGITDLRLMRPVTPDAATSYDPEGSLFTAQMLDAISHFTVVRHQLVANQQRDWSERTLPTYFNQAGGTSSAAHYGVGDPSNNGLSWEHKILLANESGRDLMLSLPTTATGLSPAETASYIWKLANLICYGSDGIEPYTGPAADPIYPPLNPNLRVYLELENELWNFASVFYVDWANVNALVAADASANTADFQAINFDGLSTAKDAGGNYVSMSTWRFRKIMLRLFQISDIFRGVFGDAAMMTRIRPLYEWQYANDNDTARLGLTFADRYFNNGDGQNHVSSPHPISHWLWGGGGATYYGAVNGNGLTELVSDPSFAKPALGQAGYQNAPPGGDWSFSGTAGIARDAGNADDIPAPYRGSQMGFITDRGTLSLPVTFPTNFTSPVFGVSFKALNRIKVGAADPDRENIRVYLDTTNDITARTFSQGNGYTPSGYDAGHPWTANNVFWTLSEYYFTRSFIVQPGSSHVITFRGFGDSGNAANTNQTVFLGEVRVTSVDRIFEDGMPGGGEATGQPVGQNLQNTMNVEATWAKAFGLEQLSYESGWSLGGDDGGSWVQLKAKYGDSRTAGVQGRFMDMFQLAGSAVNVFGTYAQWPSWADYYAQQGLLDVGQYPIVQGIDDRGSHLPSEPNNGVLVPAVLVPILASITDHSDNLGRITSAGGWINWNVIVPRAGQYQLALTRVGQTGAALVLADDSPVAGAALSGSVFLTKGLHSVKVRSTASATFQVQQISLSGLGAPAAPAILSAVDGDGQATMNWAPSPGATDYQLRFGTTPGLYTQVIDAGTANSLTVPGLTNNQEYFFAVLAGNEAGLSLPSIEKGVVPLGPGQVGSLAIWEFNGRAGNETNAAVSSASARLSVDLLKRGTGLDPSQSDWAAGMRANRFASEPSSAASHAYGANLAQAIAKKQYYQFVLRPVAGQRLSLAQIMFRGFFQNGTGGAGLTYSTDGISFSTGMAASGPTASGLWSVDVGGEVVLQNVTAPVTIRIYLFGLGAYQVSALGGGPGADLTVTGGLTPLRVFLRISSPRPDTVLVYWPTNGAGTTLEFRNSFDLTDPWAPLEDQPKLDGDSWSLPLPIANESRFFRLSP